MSDVKLTGVDQSAQRVVAMPLSQNSKASEEGLDANALGVKPDQRVQAQQKVEGQEIDPKSVESAVTKLNDYVQSVQRNLQFNLDDESGKTVITVIDRNTSAVIRQIPDDVALKLAQNLQQDEPLSLFNAKV
jgi:flagellar protein FlaG